MERFPWVGLLWRELRVPGTDYGKLCLAHLHARMVSIGSHASQECIALDTLVDYALRLVTAERVRIGRRHPSTLVLLVLLIIIKCITGAGRLVGVKVLIMLGGDAILGRFDYLGLASVAVGRQDCFAASLGLQLLQVGLLVACRLQLCRRAWPRQMIRALEMIHFKLAREQILRALAGIVALTILV